MRTTDMSDLIEDSEHDFITGERQMAVERMIYLPREKVRYHSMPMHDAVVRYLQAHRGFMQEMAREWSRLDSMNSEGVRMTDSEEIRYTQLANSEGWFRYARANAGGARDNRTRPKGHLSAVK